MTTILDTCLEVYEGFCNKYGEKPTQIEMYQEDYEQLRQEMQYMLSYKCDKLESDMIYGMKIVIRESA